QKKRQEILARNPGAFDARDRAMGALCLKTNPTVIFGVMYGMQFGRMPDPKRLAEELMTPTALVEFVYWRKKADELGIVLSPEVVMEDLLVAGANQLSEKELTDYSRSRLRKELPIALGWVGDEIRAMMAKSVILGEGQR